jgi:hypothetical protein
VSSFQRKSLPQQLAAKLEGDIGAGRFKGVLPGYRIVQQRYEVSKVTCERAFKLLELAGIISPAEHGKQRAILKRPGADRLKADPGGLLIISDVSTASHPESIQQFEACSYFWKEEGGNVRHKTVDLLRQRNPAAMLATWLTGTDTAAILIEMPPTSWVDAAENTGLHVFRLGGDRATRTNRSTRSGFSTQSAYQAVFGYLRSMGHRRLLVPWNRASPGRSWVLDALETAYHGILSRTEVQQAVPAVDHLSEGDWHNYWPVALAAARPSAVVLDRPHKAISLFCYCGRKEIKIPRDLSVFVVDGVSPIGWLTPPVAHLAIEDFAEVKHFVKWVQNGFMPKGIFTSSFKLVAGESVSRRA